MVSLFSIGINLQGKLDHFMCFLFYRIVLKHPTSPVKESCDYLGSFIILTNDQYARELVGRKLSYGLIFNDD